MKMKKYPTVEAVPNCNRRIVEKGKIDTPNIQLHDWSLFWLSTGTSIRSGRVKLVLWAQTSPLSEMMRSCKYFQHVSTMTILTSNRTINVIINIRINVQRKITCVVLLTSR